MRTCKNCNEDITHTRDDAQFCSRKCANIWNGKNKKKHSPTQICEKCKKEKSLSSFSYKVKNDFSSGRKSICKACGAAERETQRRERTWKVDAAQMLLNLSRQRAKKSNIEHTLEREDIKIPDVCPVFGFPLKRGKRNEWFASPSIDRIDNTKGYTPDNIIVVSRRANILKKDATIDELKQLAFFYEKIKV